MYVEGSGGSLIVSGGEVVSFDTFLKCIHLAWDRLLILLEPKFPRY